jgi:steroid 5-alpha reductase family enzyme
MMARSFVPQSRTGALFWIVAGYLLALGAGAVTALMIDGAPWQKMAAADLVATVVIFVLSMLCDNSSFYDPYWSVAPIPIAIYLALASDGVPLRKWLVVALVSAWGLRLTWNFARGWPGFAHEDWRYVEFRRKTGKAYWLVSFLGIHLVPTVTVFLAMLSLEPALASRRPLGALDVVAALVTAGAILLEGTADEQLRAFRRAGPAGRIMDVGLWQHCRHPNYLGEISFWWGLFLFALAVEPSAWWWTLPGPLWMTSMFVFISVPMIDRRSLERRPGYAAHMQRVPALLPRWNPTRD